VWCVVFFGLFCSLLIIFKILLKIRIFTLFLCAIGTILGHILLFCPFHLFLIKTNISCEPESLVERFIIFYLLNCKYKIIIDKKR